MKAGKGRGKLRETTGRSKVQNPARHGGPYSARREAARWPEASDDMARVSDRPPDRPVLYRPIPLCGAVLCTR